MNLYNKHSLDSIAKEQGFIRDNLEKVMRLVEVLSHFHNIDLLSNTLALKGITDNVHLLFHNLYKKENPDSSPAHSLGEELPGLRCKITNDSCKFFMRNLHKK